MLTGFFFIPSKTFAFQHAYESKSDFIYALARNELPVYYSDYSNDLKTVLPKYTGVKVIGSSGSWYEIQYASKKGGTKNGWVTRDEFHSDCLIYDGREKQPFSNGTYQLSFYEENSSDSSFAMNTASIISENFSCSFKYAGDNRYTIRKAGEEKYLKADTYQTHLLQMNFGEVNRKLVLFLLQEKRTIIQSAMKLPKEIFLKTMAVF